MEETLTIEKKQEKSSWFYSYGGVLFYFLGRKILGYWFQYRSFIFHYCFCGF